MKHLLLIIFCAVTISYAQTTTPAADLTGKWVFQVETTAGGGTPAFTFKQEGDKLTGHYSGQLGEADLAGTVKGRQLEFKFVGEVQGFRVESTYSGVIENKDSVKGTVILAGVGEGTFTGKRQ
ncbi:MAG TPA: hypothetical protein VE422_51315 [Terriglobia bacterium]|nr:hypothetical protein [Terriglobia bacterium]